MRKLTPEATAIFIQKVKQIHCDSYDYSLVDYINSYTKVKIICKEHGVFEQEPSNHLTGMGCIKCGSEKQKNILRSNTKEFIKKAILVHDNKYDYSLANYICARSKIKIICKEHTIFEQRPSLHLQGRGCPKCNSSKGELAVEQFLKEHNVQYETQKKFNDCRGKKRPLPFDFYLPDYNVCIEYDGEQHFKPICFTGMTKTKAQYQFLQTQISDSIKTKYCKDNNISLVRIEYKDQRKIVSILSTQLSSECLDHRLVASK